MNAITTSPSLDRNTSRLTNDALQSFNSFSPSTHSRSYQQRLRLTVPVAIEIRNVFPNPQTLPDKKWYRQEYSTNLLHNVQIEILANETPLSDETCPSVAERVVYRSTGVPPTLCPSWSHLQDRIPYSDLSNAAYESLKARFFSVPPKTEDPSVSSMDERPLCFLELHLHPSRLCRVPSINMDLLPLNCVLVHFSDHTLRVHPTHYPILDSTQLNKSNDGSNYNKTLSPTGSHSQAALNANGSFFEDDVFNALDPPAVPNRTDIVQDAMMVFRDIPSNTLLFQDMGDRVESNKVDGNTSPLASTALSVLENGNVEVMPDEDMFGRHQSPDSSNHDALSKQTSEMMLQLIDRELAALQEEHEEFEQSKIRLQALMDRIHSLENQNAHIKEAIQAEKIITGKSQFVLEAQQIRLMRELSFIYPIDVHGDKHYFIRGLEIPTDCYAGTVSEEVTSAAFGFLCHLTSLTSKYLGLHIRYKLHCQSSRSAIQDENGNTYPLFPGRHLDREQFEYGAQLLHRNIDCICKGRNISIPSNMHILGKVLRVYENVNEGY
jgi:hypothetical protein